MSVNESYATTAVRVAAAALEVAPNARVRLCLSDPIYKAEGARVARHLGVDERIEWEFTALPGRLAEVAAASGILLWLAEELWERGVGLTRACGTAACAALVCAARAERAERAATVSLPGGDLIVRWDESDHIWMTGPAETNFTGVFDPETGRFSINDAAA